MENIADYYYKLLGETNNPGVVLANMYNAIFDIKLERKHYVMFNKLLKLYNRFAIFHAILTIAEMDTVNHTASLFPLFSAIIKKRYEKRAEIANVKSMDNGRKVVKHLEKLIKNKSELIIPGDGDE